jgi:hypothetical protein
MDRPKTLEEITRKAVRIDIQLRDLRARKRGHHDYQHQGRLTIIKRDYDSPEAWLTETLISSNDNVTMLQTKEGDSNKTTTLTDLD